MLEIDDSRGEKVISQSEKLPIADCQLPISVDFGIKMTSAIGNWQSEISQRRLAIKRAF
jgi:hypothetical protein